MAESSRTRTNSIKTLAHCLACLCILTSSASLADEVTDDQQKLIGYMGRIRCIAERDGQSQEWEWERIRKFIEKDGYYNKELGRFSWQPAVMMAVNQFKLALQERDCNGVDRDSVIWKRAVRMTAHLNRDGTPQPGFFAE